MEFPRRHLGNYVFFLSGISFKSVVFPNCRGPIRITAFLFPLEKNTNCPN